MQREKAGSGNILMLPTCLPSVCMTILVLFKVVLKVAGDKEQTQAPMIYSNLFKVVLVKVM